jgi:hypothetical protein
MSQLHGFDVGSPLRGALYEKSAKYVLDRDVQQIATAAAVLGVVFHLTLLKPFEVEQFMYKLIALALLSPCILMSTHVLIGFTTLAAAARVTIIVSSFSAGIFGSILIYRLFFHKLRQFPGPLGAKIGKFYSVHLAIQKLQYHKEVARMHRQYGDFVRTGMSLMYAHPGSLEN